MKPEFIFLIFVTVIIIIAIVKDRLKPASFVVKGGLVDDVPTVVYDKRRRVDYDFMMDELPIGCSCYIKKYSEKTFGIVKSVGVKHFNSGVELAVNIYNTETPPKLLHKEMNVNEMLLTWTID